MDVRVILENGSTREFRKVKLAGDLHTLDIVSENREKDIASMNLQEYTLSVFTSSKIRTRGDGMVLDSGWRKAGKFKSVTLLPEVAA